MKKFQFAILMVTLALTIISWGFIGHKTVALIADNHLSFKSKAMVKLLLEEEPMGDVASWADQVLGDSAYKNTAIQHYINVPTGLTYEQFSDAVNAQGDGNLYAAIEKNIAILKDPNLKINKESSEALKFLIHFVGDAHQPMHVARKDDKGGNSIQLQFDGKGTNLHSLWDGKLIGKQGLTMEQMAQSYDNATPAQIAKWQKDDVMKWLFESYQISTKLYAEIGQNNKLDDSYYQKHVPIVQERIEMAGIRLAGLINQIFSTANIKVTTVLLPPPPISPQPVPAAPTAELKDLPGLTGQYLTVSGKVYGIKDIGSMVLVNLGAAYPNQLLTVALKGKAKGLAATITDKEISVTGTVINYKGKPEMVIDDPEMVKLK